MRDTGGSTWLLWLEDKSGMTRHQRNHRKRMGITIEEHHFKQQTKLLNDELASDLCYYFELKRNKLPLMAA